MKICIRCRKEITHSLNLSGVICDECWSKADPRDDPSEEGLPGPEVADASHRWPLR